MTVLQPQETRRMAEVGFLAAAAGDLASAECIFGALQRLQPDRAIGTVGRAMAHLNRRRHDEALSVLDQGLRNVCDADRADLLAVRALALHLAGRRVESQRSAQSVPEHALARALLAPVTDALAVAL